MDNNNILNKVLGIDINSHRPLAFFGINIDQDHESVRQWVKWCKKQGFSGFNMIVASTCNGRANEQWISKLLDAYEVAIRTAEEEGLEVWIFDDWGYPSGTAGGLVCTEPSFRLKKLVVSYDCIIEPGSMVKVTIPEKFVTAGVLLPRGQYKRLYAKPGESLEYHALDQTERLVVVSWEYDRHAAKSSCKSYPGDPAMSCIDMLNPKATQKFIEVMHERYFKRFGKYFGSVIKGFFYDEPFLSFEFPWTEELPRKFREKKGYDLLDVLPQIMINAYYSRSGQIAGYTDDYFDVWTDMAAENYYGEMSKWCRNHGVELSGHMDLDHHLNTLSTVSGHFFKNMKHNDRPAVDVIWAQIEPGVFTDFPRYAGSVKRLLGLKHATTETFAGMGHGLHADLMRYITDHQAVRGIDDFHLMYSNNNPPEKYSSSPQMPNHMLQEPFGRLIYERMAKASAIAMTGRSAATTAVYIPAFDLHRAQLGLRQVGIANAERLPWEWVDTIARQLAYAPCDFDYIWDDALLQLALVDGGLMTGSGQIIDTIILPPNCTLIDGVVQKLRDFHQKGGKIIAAFRAQHLFEKEAIVCSEISYLDKYVKKYISIKPQSNISVHTRLEKGRTIFMLLNESLQEAEVEISIDSEGKLYELSLADDSIKLIKNNPTLKFNTVFEGCQLKVFIVDNSDSIPIGILDSMVQDESRATTPFNWEVKLPDGSTKKLEGNKWPDWAELGWSAYSGLMKYNAEFCWTESEDCAVLKVEGLHYHSIVYIDSKEAGRILFKPYELKLNGLKKGMHTIELHVYNTTANEVCGTYEIERERYSRRFAHMADHDRKRLKSGLLQPAMLIPLKMP